MRGDGYPERRHASGYIREDSILIDKHRSGYPCRQDLACRFISTTSEGRNEHEAHEHQIPPPPHQRLLGVRAVKATARTLGGAG